MSDDAPVAPALPAAEGSGDTMRAGSTEQRVGCAHPSLVFPDGYEPGEEIGRGGMGVVYRAREVDLDRDVAVKLLRDDYATDSEAAVRFREEARITARLQHPNIPPVHRVGALPNGRPYLVMKLVKGRKTLKSLLEERAGIEGDRGRFMTIFEAVAQAVAYAHERRVIHRDLKPGNVMVGAFGEVQVMDWGLAKVLTGEAPSDSDVARPALDTLTVIRSPRDVADQGTQAGAGTPAFMSPEQAAGESDKIDRRSDVFGLGAILCRILTEHPPYTGRNVKEIQVKAIRGQTAEALARLDGCGADPELVALAKRCLEVEPANRPANGGEVAKAVAEWRILAEERARQTERENAAKEAADAARGRAKESYLLALTTFNQLVFDVQAKLETRTGTLALQRELLANARIGLQNLLGAAEKQGRPDRTLIWSHFRMGGVELLIGNTSAALSEYQTGHELARRLADADPGDPEAQRDLGVSLNRLGDATLQLGRAEEALNLYARALEVSRRLADANPNDVRCQRDLGVSFSKLGDVALQVGRTEEARGWYERDLDVSRRLAEQDPLDSEVQRDLLVSYFKIGSLHQEVHAYAEASELYTRAATVAQTFPRSGTFADELAVLTTRLAQCRAALGSAV